MTPVVSHTTNVDVSADEDVSYFHLFPFIFCERREQTGLKVGSSVPLRDTMIDSAHLSDTRAQIAHGTRSSGAAVSRQRPGAIKRKQINKQDEAPVTLK